MRHRLRSRAILRLAERGRENKMGIPVRRVQEAVEVAEGDGFYFYSLKPWASYPFVARTIIRFLYWYYNWNTSDGSFESQGFYDTFQTVAEAEAFARSHGWGVQQMPKNTPLPSVTCQYGYNDVPGSKAKWVTTERNLKLVVSQRSWLKELSKATKEFREIL
jgi:hypothetical protein